VPGIGKRTAERLIVDLQDRVRGIAAAAPTVAARATTPDDEVVSALVNLGYRRGDAEQAVRRAMQGGESDLATLIRKALRQLSG
jgi:Holliday junction DNA helicase RuvA